MKNKNYNTFGTVQKSNRKIVETESNLTYRYMTAHFPGVVQNNLDTPNIHT